MVLKKSTKQWIAFLLATLPAIYIFVGAPRGWLGFNPQVRAIELSGNWAIVFLLVSLAGRPLKELGVKFGMTYRKPIGLASFGYGMLHLFFYVFWNYGGDLRLVWMTLPQQKFIFFGLGGLLILLAMAVTSHKFAVRKLKKWWQRLHRLVYVAGILILVHALLASKGNQEIFLIYGSIFVVLMLGRIPVLLRWLKKRKILQST